MNAHFDTKAKVRDFKRGDKVHAFIPVPGSPLQAKYHGPYTITKKISEQNYIIDTPDRRKNTQNIHINLLKSRTSLASHS